MRIISASCLMTVAFTLACSSIKTDPSRSSDPRLDARNRASINKTPRSGRVVGQAGPEVAVPTSFNPVKTAQDFFDSKDYKRTIVSVNQSLENPALLTKERELLWSLRLRAWEASSDANSVAVTKMGDTELSMIAKESLVPSIRAVAFLRLGEGKLLEHKQEEAREYFQKVLQEGGSDEYTRRANEYLGSLDSLKRVEPKTIGVVLPLTGKNASVAQRTLRGIQMGLGLTGKGNSSFRLAVMDSEGRADLARRGVERLVQEDNVIAIVGGLTSKTAVAEAAQATELGVPTITLSLKSGVTELGPFVFRNSLTTEMQVRHLARVAIEEMGMKRFAILFPNDAYGVEAANLFWDEILARGGQVTAAQVYSPKETDYRDVVRRLAGTYYSDSRADEYRARFKDLSEKEEKKPKSARKNENDSVLAPIVDFDAIFVPDGLKALGQVAAAIAYSDIRNVRLLGTNLWNSPTVAKRAGLFSSNLLFVDSFSPSDSRFLNAPFVKDYRATFSEDPGLFEIQGYDSALMLRQLISQGASSRQTLAQALNQLQNLPGLLSPLSVSDDREIQRPVVALTFDGNQVSPWKPSKTP